MTNMIENNVYLTGGAEIEIHNATGNRASVSDWQRVLDNSGFSWVEAKRDASPNVDCEFVLPPFPLHFAGGARDDIERLLAFIELQGGRVVKSGCGLHIHVGNRMVKNMSPVDFWEASKAAFTPTGRNRCYYRAPDMTDVMPLALVRDVIQRYAEHQSKIDAIVAPSRRDGGNASRFCRSIRHVAFRGHAADQFERADNAARMAETLGGKFGAINMQTWSRIGTVEFRQHQATLDIEKLEAWCLLIDSLFRYSDQHRLDYVSPATTTVATPEMPHRAGSRLAVMWAMCRRDGGAHVSDISARTGWTADTIRARVSEWRNTHGDQAVITHTQQAYGHRYGSSNGGHDLNGYEIPREITTTVAGGVALYPENRRGVTSIWAGLDDQTFEYFNARRDALRR
jgi:hypothetical protein